MKKITHLLFLIVFSVFSHTVLFAQDNVIAVIQEPFVVLLDPADGSVVDNQFIDLTPLNQGTPKDLLQVGNELWISDQIEDRIDRFDLEGTFLSTIDTGLDNIKGMEVVDDEVWVTNAGSMNGAPGDAIVRFDFNGANLGFYDTAGVSSFDIIDVGNNEVYISYIGTGTKIERRDYDGNILGDLVPTGVVTFIQQMELNSDNNSVYASVFSNTGSNLAGLYEFSRTDGSILDNWELGSLRGVAALDNGTILVSGGTGFGIQILDPGTGNTTNVNSTNSAQYFARVSFCTAPPTPTGDANQTFNSGATLDDIVITPSNVTWFATESDALANENPLPGTTLLVDGETYYAVNIVDGCLSAPFAVTVEILLGNDSFDFKDLKLFPNPTDRLLTVKFSSEITSLKLSNLLGQEVFSESVNETDILLDLSALSNGIYLLTVEVEGVSNTVKVIKD